MTYSEVTLWGVSLYLIFIMLFLKTCFEFIKVYHDPCVIKIINVHLCLLFSACENGKYGRGCNHDCGFCARGPCDKQTGFCSSGCQAGYLYDSERPKCDDSKPSNTILFL